MFNVPVSLVRGCRFAVLLLLGLSARFLVAASWTGVVYDRAGKPATHATIALHASSGAREYSVRSSTTGEFLFANIDAGRYRVTVSVNDKTWAAGDLLVVKEGSTLTADLKIYEQDQTLGVIARDKGTAPQGSGGEHLSSGEVSSLPLNERDFSKLLLLAAGTMTDTNGAAN